LRVAGVEWLQLLDLFHFVILLYSVCIVVVLSCK